MFYEVEFTLEVVLGHEQGTVGFRVRIAGKVISHTYVRVDDGGKKVEKGTS
jgi:hypothetical protein